MENIMSLFSGCGGLDLGFYLAGNAKISFANDISPVVAETYSYNFGHKVVKTDSVTFKDDKIFVIGDIRDIDIGRISHNFDCIIGGPPCQDFSVIKGHKKQGINSSRGSLYSYFIKAIKHFCPKFFVFENVCGLVSCNKNQDYNVILNSFKELKDYIIVFNGVIDATCFGVAQRRKRLIIIGIHRSVKESFCLKNSLFSKYPMTSLEVFEGLPLPDLQKKYVEIVKEYETIDKDLPNNKLVYEWKEKVYNSLSLDIVKDYLRVNDIKPENNKEIDDAFTLHDHVLKKLGYYNSNVEQKHFMDGSNEIPVEVDTVKERLFRIGFDENYQFVQGTKWAIKGVMSFIYRRLHPLKPSYTIIAQGGGGTKGYHYRRDRSSLTNRERARLQSFPDSFMFKGNSTEQRKQIGEAVPPLLSYNLALQLIR